MRLPKDPSGMADATGEGVEGRAVAAAPLCRYLTGGPTEVSSEEPAQEGDAEAAAHSGAPEADDAAGVAAMDEQAAGSEAAAPEAEAVAAQPSLRAFVAGLADAGLERLRGVLDVTTDSAELDSVEAVLVSTRLSRPELRPLLATVRAQSAAPIVALAHTGGESMAVEIVRAGGLGVLAEGNEAALRALVEGSAHDQSMLETYERQIGQTSRVDAAHGRDRVTGLPGRSVFTQRVEDLHASGEAPRIVLVRLMGLRGSGARVSAETLQLVRRRLALAFTELLRETETELYSIDDTDFGLIGLALDGGEAERLGHAMARVVETFAPLDGRPLTLAAGHAGPEASVDAASLLSIAQRALDVAAAERETTVVNAESLALGVSATTELAAAQAAVAVVERQCGVEGHAQRVAHWSGEIAWQLGLQGQARTRVQLAALLHDAGRIALPAETMAPPAEISAEALEAYQTHPARGAAWLVASAGARVAEAVRAHHERWDGQGYPDGRGGEEIPLAARILRVADAFGALVCGRDPEAPAPPGPAAAARVIEERAGAELDPAIVEVAVPVLEKLASEQR